MKKDIFNKDAMEHLSTVEKIDRRIKMISPPDYIFAVALCIAFVAAAVWCFVGTVTSTADYEGVVFGKQNVIRLTSKADGVIKDVMVDVGDYVEKGDILAVVSNDEFFEKTRKNNMKQKKYSKSSKKYKQIEDEQRANVSKMAVVSGADGYVQTIELSGEKIDNGDTVATVIPASGQLHRQVYIYATQEEVRNMSVGMSVQVTPEYVNREEYGYIDGYISKIHGDIATEDMIKKHMGMMDYVEDLLPGKACVEVVIEMNIDEDDGGYSWSNKKGKELNILTGDRCLVRVMKREYRPYQMIFDWS